MYPGPTEGGGKALILLQVWQSIIVKLHGLAGKPATKFVDALFHPASGISVRVARADFMLPPRLNTHLLMHLCRLCM